jgi:threonylcarbamoyladenosine tRNA methylthiotransferase MtaB
MAFTYSIKTMGCKANIYDSLLIERELTEIGGVRASEDAPDVFVLNSCTVTAEADKQCFREVAHAKKKSKETWTIVTGCFAEVAEEKVKANEHVSLVVPNSKKSRLQHTIAERFGIALEKPVHDPEIYWGQLPFEAGKKRAFLKIQEGCNDFCTYCIIPYARGKSRSMRPGPLIAEVQRLADLGVKEVVITGTNIGDFGKEFDSCFEDLLEALITHTSIPRIRLTSLDPSEVSDRILNLIGETGPRGAKLMPHFHISLQSPVSRVLRAMKRDYKTEDVISALNRIYNKSPEIYVGMDVIAGFVSETKEEHQEAVQILKDTPWARLHVFPYSEREGTPALKIKGSVPVAERRERANELLALSRQKHEAFAQRFLNRSFENVLFENWHEAGGDYYLVGHAENYSRVMARVPSRLETDAKAMANMLGRAHIVGLSPKPAQDFTLEGFLDPIKENPSPIIT